MPLASAKMHRENEAPKVSSLRDRWELRLQISEIKALSNLPIGDGARWLFLHLSTFTNNNKKECYPSQVTLMELTGFSKSKLKRCTNELVEAGLIDVKVARKQHRSNTYVIHKPSKPKNRGFKSDPSKKTASEGSDLCSQRVQICSPRGSKNDPLNNTIEINNRNTPLTPQGGASNLVFEIGKKPRNGSTWDEWDSVRLAIKKMLSEEDYEPMLGCHFAVRKNNILFIDSYHPISDFSSTLKNAIRKEITKYGISVIRIKE